MFLTCLMAAPTLVRIQGEPYLARPLTLGGYAALVRNAGDDLDADGDRGEGPAFGSAEMMGWLDGPGMGLVFWCALSRDRPGLGIAGAEALAAVAGDAERAAVLSAALRRAHRPEELGTAGRSDAGAHDWSAVVYRYFEEGGRLPDDVAGLSLDQADAIASRGKGGEALEAANAMAAQAEWERLHGAAAGAQPVAPDAGDRPATIADHGYAFAPGDEPAGGGGLIDG